MGFTNGAYATVWEVEQKSQGLTRVRLAISRKNKDTGEFEQKFGGYVAFAGSAVAGRAARLKPRDRIRLLRTDVENRWDKAAQKEYLNFYVFDFEDANGPGGGIGEPVQNTVMPAIDDGDPEVEDDLPF